MDPDSAGARAAAPGPVSSGEPAGGHPGPGGGGPGHPAAAHGFEHLAEWAIWEDADLVLIPVSLVNPDLFERLRGYSLKTLLEHTDRPVLVVYPDGSTWRANSGEPSNRQERSAAVLAA